MAELPIVGDALRAGNAPIVGVGCEEDEEEEKEETREEHEEATRHFDAAIETAASEDSAGGEVIVRGLRPRGIEMPLESAAPSGASKGKRAWPGGKLTSNKADATAAFHKRMKARAGHEPAASDEARAPEACAAGLLRGEVPDLSAMAGLAVLEVGGDCASGDSVPRSDDERDRAPSACQQKRPKGARKPRVQVLEGGANMWFASSEHKPSYAECKAQLKALQSSQVPGTERSAVDKMRKAVERVTAAGEKLSSNHKHSGLDYSHLVESGAHSAEWTAKVAGGARVPPPFKTHGKYGECAGFDLSAIRAVLVAKREGKWVGTPASASASSSSGCDSLRAVAAPHALGRVGNERLFIEGMRPAAAECSTPDWIQELLDGRLEAATEFWE